VEPHVDDTFLLELEVPPRVHRERCGQFVGEAVELVVVLGLLEQ